MTDLTDQYLADADRFTDLLTSAQDTDWSAPSPCEGWSAADVVDHVVDTQRGFFAQRDADLGERPAGTPDEMWAAHTDAVRRTVADDAFVTLEYDGYFGRTTVADTLARFYGFDLLVHHWDVARALGRDVVWDEAEMDRIDTALDGFGEHLYAEGICKPPLEAPADAPRQVRLLARMGRTA
ncbi:maleylpyruvate isomerase family mycothiol-dependent enzyme [Nocardioides sp. 503]|uniref:maleylpyruvate isomerase family mycothiol-dependent enzyme n=1 Tax=Nocardioides sp. 503 TaxID=2508326 RepID=UPI001070128D|nr:maleylpyruvate isomerase family mycothiol-dependent enzyme [Nocardioides sp. 503]